jgi:hypothetical protein
VTSGNHVTDQCRSESAVPRFLKDITLANASFRPLHRGPNVLRTPHDRGSHCIILTALFRLRWPASGSLLNAPACRCLPALAQSGRAHAGRRRSRFVPWSKPSSHPRFVTQSALALDLAFARQRNLHVDFPKKRMRITASDHRTPHQQPCSVLQTSRQPHKRLLRTLGYRSSLGSCRPPTRTGFTRIAAQATAWFFAYPNSRD